MDDQAVQLMVEGVLNRIGLVDEIAVSLRRANRTHCGERYPELIISLSTLARVGNIHVNLPVTYQAQVQIRDRVVDVVAELIAGDG